MDKLLASQVSVIYFLTAVFCIFIFRMAQKSKRFAKLLILVADIQFTF